MNDNNLLLFPTYTEYNLMHAQVFTIKMKCVCVEIIILYYTPLNLYLTLDKSFRIGDG